MVYAYCYILFFYAIRIAVFMIAHCIYAMCNIAYCLYKQYIYTYIAYISNIYWYMHTVIFYCSMQYAFPRIAYNNCFLFRKNQM